MTSPDAIKLQHVLLPVTHTKKAAMLLTLGVPFLDPSEPASNVYSEGKPYRPGQPGHVTYHMADKNAQYVAATDLMAQWDDYTSADKLDELVNEIFAAQPELGQKLRDILPLALAAYIGGYAKNHMAIIDMWKKVKPMVLVEKSATSFALVELKPSDETRRRCGI